MKTDFLYRALRANVFFLMGVFISGCSSLGESDVDPDKELDSLRAYSEETETSTVKMSESTIFIKGDVSHDLQSFDPVSGTITFANSDLLKNQEIKVGDIIYSTERTEKTPNGYCLRVISIKESNGTVTYETEPESILEAINYLKETDVLSAGNYKPEDIHVFSFPIEESNNSPKTRADIDITKDKDGIEIKSEKLDFKSDGKETSFDVVVWEDKASGDITSGKFQVKLGIRVQHEFLESMAEIDDGMFVLYAMVKLGVGVKVEMGTTFSLSMSQKEPAEMTEEERTLYERQKTLEDMAKASLVGKRFRLVDLPLNYTCTKVVIDPRFVVYGEFKLDLSGKLVVETGIEDGVYALNVQNEFLNFEKLSYLRRVTNFKQYFRINSSISFTAEAGFGLGLNFEIPGLPVKKDSYVGPSAFGVWFGFDLSEKVKVEWNKDVLSGKTEIKATGEDGEVSCRASISGVVGIKKRSVDIDWTFWPKEGAKELFTIPGWEWSMYLSTPAPYDLQSAVEGSSANLSWKIPTEGMFDETRIHIVNSLSKEVIPIWKTNYQGTSALYGPGPDGTYYWYVETVSKSYEHFPSDTLSFVIDASKVTTGVPEKSGSAVTVPVEINSLNNILERGVVYSTEHREPLADVDVESHYTGTEKVFNQEITGLDPSDTYYLRGYALISVDGGSRYVYGNVEELTGQNTPTSFTVSPSEIDFGRVEYGTDKTARFSVTNTGKGILRFSIACECHDNVFEVGGGEEQTLATGATKEFTVTAHGMKRNSSASCDIRIISSAENGTQTVKVQAEGWDNRPLMLETTSKTMKVGDKDQVNVIFGSLDYEISNDNPSVVNAIISTQGDGGGGWYDYWRYTFKYVNLEALAVGTATIKVTDKERNEDVTLLVTVTDSGSVFEAIDLGLPSGLKWASFNLGATKPEGYGDYYTWGETEPYYSCLDPLTWKPGKAAGYNYSSYKWCMGDSRTMTKYCTISSDGYNGFTDDKTVLDPEDDAAHVNLGGNWRMPTGMEWLELKENCIWTWTMRNGVNGYLITGSNGNNIFLPAAGFRIDTDLRCVGTDGYYWLSSLHTYPFDALNGFFDSDLVIRSSNARCCGFTVRPVSGDSASSNYILYDPSPKDGATGVDPHVYFSCSGHLYDQGENNFEVRVSEESDMSNPLPRSVRFCGPYLAVYFDELESNKTYYWQVKEFDFEKGEWVIVSPIWHFTTK